jgi:hypothetical protein
MSKKRTNVSYVKFSPEEMAIDANDFDASLPSEMFRWTDAEKAALQRAAFVVCIAVGGHEGKIDVGKVYRVAKPLKNDAPQWLRIMNEHGEAARYPIGWFVPVALPALAQRALAALKAA